MTFHNAFDNDPSGRRPGALRLFFTVVLAIVVFSSAAIGLATLHFTCVFTPSFLALLGPMQAIFVRWRFKGGQFGKL